MKPGTKNILNTREWRLWVFFLTLCLWFLMLHILARLHGVYFFLALVVSWTVQSVLILISSPYTEIPLARRKNVAARWMLAIGAALAVLAPLELTLSLANKRFPLASQLTQPAAWELMLLDGDRHFTYYGHTHRQNSQGFRNSEFKPKNPKVFRIAVIGDSLVYGSGVAEKLTLTSRIQQSLHTSYRVEVLNLGVSGYNHSNYLS